MDFDKYQYESNKTAKYPDELAIEYLSLGMCSEAGEVAGKVKKIIRDDGRIISAEKREDLSKEIGDVLWYVSQLALELDIPLSKIAKDNITKLSKRLVENKISGSGDNR